MTELLPCPFCGGGATYKETPGSLGYTRPAHAVGCETCGYSLRAHPEKETWWKEDDLEAPKAAITAWNTRRPA